MKILNEVTGVQRNRFVLESNMPSTLIHTTILSTTFGRKRCVLDLHKYSILKSLEDIGRVTIPFIVCDFFL